MSDWKNRYSVMRRANQKYPYYEGTFSYNGFEKGKLAQSMRKSRVGWGRRAVEMRANKTHFDTFENDTIGLGKVFRDYRAPEAFNKLKDDILVAGVGFLAVSGDRVMPFTALEATGEYDWYDQNLKSGVAVFRDTTKANTTNTQPPDSYIEYSQNQTVTGNADSETIEQNRTGRPLMTLLTHKSTTKQPFGHSVLATPVRDAIIDASRTTRQAMIAAHHYNTKVDVLLGVDSETSVNTVEKQDGDALLVGPNESGQIPQIGQFAQHAMAPFNETILIAAKNFCADTKLSLANLGISSEAPQSPEALEIVGDDLRDDIREWQREIGDQLKYFAVTLWMHKNGISTIDANLQEKIDAIKPVWLPVFRPDVGKFGDGLYKTSQTAPRITRQRSVWRNFGLTSAEIDDVIKDITPV